MQEQAAYLGAQIAAELFQGLCVLLAGASPAANRRLRMTGMGWRHSGLRLEPGSSRDATCTAFAL